jgi:hypothetical protein
MPAFPRRRRWTRRDDRGSMPLALLVTLVGVSLSASLSGMVIGQLKTSARAAERATALSNAQAGLDFALNKIRLAVTLTGAGDITKLPCDWSAAAVAPAASSGYSVSVGYFVNDPTGLAKVLADTDPNYINLGNATDALTNVNNLLTAAGSAAAGLNTVANGAIKCVSGVLTDTPLFGLVKATGVAGPNGGTTRTLFGTYIFHNSDDNINGGQIVIAGTGGQYCIGDNSSTPQANDKVVAVPCTSTTAVTKFIYPKNLNLVLKDTRTSSTNTTTGSSYPYGLCITATPPVDGTLAVFQPCASSGTRIPSQQYDYDVNRQTYYGATVTGGARSGLCLNVNGTVSTGQQLALKSSGNCGTAGVTGKAFVPDEYVGPGGAGTTSGQYVNLGEQGRCLDLTNEDPAGTALKNAGKPVALIAYPCKQTFSGDVYWNHKWTGPLTPALINVGVTSATGIVYTTKPSPLGNWCVQSPGASGGFVWVAVCNNTDASLTWTVYGATGSNATAYQVVDQNGLCLTSAVGRGSSYVFSSSGTLTISYVIAAPCSNDPAVNQYQKWNAPNTLQAGPLQGIQEK